MSIKYVQTNTLFLAGSGVIVGATTIILTNFSDIYGNVLTMSDFGDKGYITLEPDTNNEEAATFTSVAHNANGTFTLGGVKTGLAVSPYTETSGLIRSHAGGTKVVVTDNVEFWNTFANKENDETINGQWTFSSFPITPSNSNASVTVKGVTKLSVAPVSSTNPIAVGINDQGRSYYGVDSVGTDAYAITITSPITSYTSGQTFTFKAGTSNTAAATLNVNSIGAIAIKKNGSTALSTGDILSGQIITVIYDGTNFQMQSNIGGGSVPIVNTFTSQNFKGDATTEFTITNTSGNTYRYTYTGSGTTPGNFTSYLSVGSIFNIQSSDFNTNNRGIFTVTAVQATYIEVTNASGVAESTKTLTNGYLDVGTVYTPTSGTKYVVVEVQGAGYAGIDGAGSGGGSPTGGFGGGAGAYAKKLLTSSFSGKQVIVGLGIANADISTLGLLPAGTSAFGAAIQSTGGEPPSNYAPGGSAVGGDVNTDGNGGGTGSSFGGGNGGGTPLGGGAAGSVSGNATSGQNGSGGAGGGTSGGNRQGGDGGDGIVIITEYFN